jgi:hypothetical protein
MVERDHTGILSRREIIADALSDPESFPGVEELMKSSKMKADIYPFEKNGWPGLLLRRPDQCPIFDFISPPYGIG